MHRSQQGLSLIELLLVISLVMILGTASAPLLSQFLLYNNFDLTAQKVVGSLRKAQNYSITHRLGQNWGVCVYGNAVRIYAGSCGSPSFHQDTPLEPNITVSGVSNIVFNRRGEPSAPVTVTVTSSIESVSYTLNSAGRISQP